MEKITNEFVDDVLKMNEKLRAVFDTMEDSHEKLMITAKLIRDMTVACEGDSTLYNAIAKLHHAIEEENYELAAKIRALLTNYKPIRNESTIQEMLKSYQKMTDNF